MPFRWGASTMPQGNDVTWATRALGPKDLGQKRRRLSILADQLQTGPDDRESGRCVFSCLDDILACYGSEAPDRAAILAPDCAPLTYGALRALVTQAVRELRDLGLGPTDRVAVVLPIGAETAVAIL